MTKILIIEDEPNMVAGLRDNFEFEGYEVAAAYDGVEGLERAALSFIPSSHSRDATEVEHHAVS